MRFDVLTLFPELVSSILSESIIGRAQKAGYLSVYAHNIRDWSEDKNRRVDDTPYGGGMGMLMAAPPVYNCYDAVRSMAPEMKTRVIYMSPKGRVLTQSHAKELKENYERIIILCGHYEGIDQRVLDEVVDEEISIGDYVVTGGEIPACIVIDAVSRLIDGVLTSSECYEGESVASGILEYPQYTKPAVWQDREVPQVLLSGHHANIEKWRREQSLLMTAKYRPDMLEKAELTKKDSAPSGAL